MANSAPPQILEDLPVDRVGLPVGVHLVKALAGDHAVPDGAGLLPAPEEMVADLHGLLVCLVPVEPLQAFPELKVKAPSRFLL